MKEKKQIKMLLTVFLTLSVLLVGRPANSTTLARMSIAQMTNAARFVVRARCASNVAAWDRGEIWTFTSFAVEEIWKGPPALNSTPNLTVRLLGGTVGNLTSSVSGIPHFLPGEEVVLFLEQTSRGDYSIVSWVQGTFRVRRDLHTGQLVAVQDTASFDTFDPATRQFRSTGLRDIAIEHFHAIVNAGGCATASCPQGTK